MRKAMKEARIHNDVQVSIFRWLQKRFKSFCNNFVYYANKTAFKRFCFISDLQITL